MCYKAMLGAGSLMAGLSIGAISSNFDANSEFFDLGLTAAVIATVLFVGAAIVRHLNSLDRAFTAGVGVGRRRRERHESNVYPIRDRRA